MIHATLKSFQFLFLFFVFHRITIFPFISESMGLQAPAHLAQAFLVGLMSDLWIACLGSFIIACSEILLIIIRLRRFCSSFRKVFLLVVLALTSMHYSYVAFFHYPVIPLHVPYMTDLAFLRGNWGSLLSPGVMLSFLTGLGALFLIRKKTLSLSVKTRWIYTMLVLALGVGAHILHIRYKIQWFIPEPLQYNLFEGLAFKAGHNHRAVPLSQEELVSLQNAYGTGTEASQPEDILSGLHFSDSAREEAGGFSPLLEELAKKVQQSVKDGKKPLLLTVLMESFRWADSGAYGNVSESLTPEFDAMAKDGILFLNAYSVSNVTRGGQEAVWCGYLSSQSRSAMRDRTDLPVRCLPEHLKSGETFWIHGGEGRFDNQKVFWQKHGVHHLTAQEDLPKALAKTGWGIGDFSLNKIAANKISEIHRTSSAEFLFGMILSVSNHIPWDVPGDAPADLMEWNYQGIHPSERTVRYADIALGRLVRSLQEADLWNQTVLVVVGDHGIRAPALNPSLGQISPGEQSSHISLLLSGGLVEQLGPALSPEGRNRSEFVSQADIAPFWARLLGLKGFSTMGESLLKKVRSRPVIADLGTSVYFPETGREVAAASLLKSREQADPRFLFYRSLIQWIDMWSLQQDRLAVTQARQATRD